jgi:hypothetical protein
VTKITGRDGPFISKNRAFSPVTGQITPLPETVFPKEKFMIGSAHWRKKQGYDFSLSETEHQ